jgi:hypothetical protein
LERALTVLGNVILVRTVFHAAQKENENMHSKKLGLLFAGLHLVAFLATIFYIRHSASPQASLIWGIFAIFDFPISSVYFFAGGAYSKWLDALGNSSLAQIAYLPHLIHGLLGTIWWYFLPRFFMPRKLGGLWGKRN